MITLKLATLAVIFVVTGGAVFAEWGRRNPLLIALASIVAMIGAFYLFRDIYNDLKVDLHTELNRPDLRPSATTRPNPPRTPSRPETSSNEPFNPSCIHVNGRLVC